LQQTTGDVQAKFKSVNGRTDKEGNGVRHEGTAVAETSGQQKPRMGELIPVATVKTVVWPHFIYSCVTKVL
jgi:hypothetical protein